MQDLAFPLGFVLAPWTSSINWLQTILDYFSPERLVNTQKNPPKLIKLNDRQIGINNPNVKIQKDIINLVGLPVTYSKQIALAVKATFFDSDPKKHDITSRPHSRLDIAYTLFRGILTILSIMLVPTSFGEESIPMLQLWVMTVTCTILSGILAIGYIWYIPFYNYNYSILRAGMMLNFFWASLCLLFTVVRPFSDIGVIYVVLCPITFVLGYYFVGLRRSMVENTQINLVTDPLVLELKVRFKLMEFNLLYNSKHGTAGGLGDKNTVVEIGVENNAAEVETAKATERALLDEINDMYSQGAKTMTKSCMLHLFMSSFQLVHLGNRAQCLAVTAKAALMNPNLDEAFLIFKRQRLLNDKFGGGDVIDFIAYEQNLKLAKENERKATIASVQFWSELMKRNPSFQKLQTHGASISTAVSLAQMHFSSLIKLSPNNPLVFRLYGKFLMNNLNDKRSGQILIDHADELEEDQEREDIGKDEESEHESDAGNCSSLGSDLAAEENFSTRPSVNLFSEDNGVITISGEPQNLGQIVTANNYLKTGAAKVIDKSRQVLGLHKDGYLTPLILHVKHAVDASGKQSFLGVLKPAKKSPTAGFVMFSADQLKVKYASQNIGEIFNFQHSRLADVSATDWFPGLTVETIDQVTKAGFRTEIERADEKISFKVSGDKLAVGENVIYITRVLFRNTSKSATEVPKSLQEYLRSQTVEIQVPHNANQMEQQSEPNEDPFQDSCKFDTAIPMVFSAQSSKEVLHESKENIFIPADTPDNLNIPAKFFSEDSRKKMSFSGKRQSFEETPPHSPGEKTKHVAEQRLKKLDQRSEGSGSKASSARNVKKIISEQNTTSNKHINAIEAVYVIGIILLWIAAIFSDLEFSTTLSGITQRIENLNSLLLSALYTVQIADAVRSLDMHRIKWVENYNMISADTIAGSRAQILNNTEYIATVMSLITIYQFQQTPLINISGLSYTAVNYFEAVSLFLAGSEYVAQVDLNDSQIVENMQFVMNNGPTMILAIFNNSAIAEMNDYVVYTSTEPAVFFTIAILAPCFAFILIFLIIFPLYYHIEKYRNKFLTMFCDIPKEIVRGIYESNLQRLVEAQEDEEEGQSNVIGNGGYENQMAIENLMVSSTVDDIQDIGFDTSGLKNSMNADPIVATKKFKITTALKNFFMSNHRLGVYSIFFVVLTAAYFLTAGYLSYSYIISMQSTATSTLWTLQRSIYTTLAVFGCREQFYGTTHRLNITNTTEMVTSVFTYNATRDTAYLDSFANDLNWMDYSRLYGSSQMSTPPLILSDDSYSSLYIEVDNGCPDTSSDPTDCTSTMGGILASGLHAGIEWLNDLILFIGDVYEGRVPVVWTLNIVEFSDQLFGTLRNLNSNYLTPNIQTSGYLFWQSWQDSAAKFSLIQIIASCCYIFVLLLLYVFVVRASLSSIGQEMQRTSALVHMVPSEIIRTVPSFKHWAVEMGLKPPMRMSNRRKSDYALQVNIIENAPISNKQEVSKAGGKGKEAKFEVKSVDVLKSADFLA
ncbi:hypothetical protein HK100_011499 [Physocladia obscura]|uniref:TmcB/TmcC TPR repeats domain-containing protein n=1 Tax=Physocladia obscura TaxID=109957 RepID=A0AAD5T1B1_9FUNG|nr:hypothetical protein HK100_011499 [Physocladia obscura]